MRHRERGFMEVLRKTPEYRTKDKRVKDYSAVELQLSTGDLQEQASRCMDCGVPFCQSAKSSLGCTVANLIPEFNDRSHGQSIVLKSDETRLTSEYNWLPYAFYKKPRTYIWSRRRQNGLSARAVKRFGNTRFWNKGNLLFCRWCHGPQSSRHEASVSRLYVLKWILC